MKKYKETELSKIIERVVYLLFILAVFGSGYGTLHAQKDYDCTSELNKITDALEEGEYLNGYGTFWNGNVLTELSNGKIDAYVWREKIDDLYHWLQFVSHDYIKPSGKVFMLLKGSEKDLVSWANNLSKASILYQSDEYVVFGFDSYEEMKALLS